MKVNKQIEKLQSEVKNTDDQTKKVKLLKEIKTLKEKQCIVKH